MSLIFVCAGFLNEVCAQDSIPYVSFSGEGERLDRALLAIRRDYDIKIAYDSRALRAYNVSGTGERILLSDILKMWLQETGFTYTVVDDTYVIVRATISNPGVQPETFNYPLHGRVVDELDGEPLPFATIVTRGSNKGAVSNEQGWFTLYGVNSDTATVTISYLGYQSFSFPVPRDYAGETVVFRLPKVSANLPVALITTERQKRVIESRVPALVSIDPELAFYLPGTGEPDPVRTLQLLAGVSGALESSANIHIRGGAADENLVVYDGFTIYYLDHFYGLFSAFNANAIKNIRLHKGVFEPKFGGRASAVIEITGKQGSQELTRGKLDVNMLSTALHLETPIIGNKASLMLSARRSFTDVIFSPVYRSLFTNLYGNSTNTTASESFFRSGNAPDFNFYDFTAKVGWESKANDRFSFTIYNGRDRLAMQFAERTRDDRFMFEYNDRSQWGNTGVGTRWAKQWDATHAGNLTVGFSTYRSELFGFDRRMNIFLGTQDTLFFDRNTEISDLSIRYDHEMKLNQHTLGFGTASTAMRVENSRLDSDGDFAESVAAESLLALYVQDVYAMGDDLALTGGWRTSFYTGLNRLYHEPRITAEWMVHPNLTLHGGAGRNFQFIRNLRRQDLFLNTADEWRLADGETLPVLRADQVTAGATYRRKHIKLDAEVYHKWSQGTVEDALRFTAFDQGTFENDLLVGRGRARGLELMVSKPEGLHTGWIAYTWARAFNSFDALPKREVPAYFDRRHEAKLVYSFRPGRFSFNAVFVYAQGLPYTAATGVVDVDLINGGTRPLVAFSELNGARLPDYHRLDLSATYACDALGGKLLIGLSVYNVYDRMNIRDRYYFSSGTQADNLLVDFNDLVFLGMIPSLQMSIEW